MKPSRVLLEVARDATRGAHLHLLAGSAAAVALLALAASEGMDIYFVPVYALLPLGMAPLAARLVARDRERGTAAALATTPLTRVEWLLAKCVFLTLFLIVAVALTVPATAAVLARAGPNAFVANAHFFGWALLIGAASAAAGLLAGTLLTRNGAPALSAAFGVAIAWGTLAGMAPSLVQLADTPAGRQAVLAVAHLSPVTWAYDGGVPMHDVRLAPASPDPALGALLLTPALLAIAAIVALRLQHLEGWLNPLRRHRGALAALIAVVALTGSAYGGWAYDVAPRHPEKGVWQSADGSFSVEYRHIMPRHAGGFDLRNGAPVHLDLLFRGEPGRVLNVTALRIESPSLQFEREDAPPFHIQILNEGPAVGLRSHRFNFTVTYDALGPDAHVPLTVAAVVENEEVALDGIVIARPPESPTMTRLVGGGAPLLLALSAARTIPRRVNRW